MHPLCGYSSTTPVLQRISFRFLKDADLTKFLRTQLPLVFPSPSHLYRLRTPDIRTHSLRVTALLLLKRAGASDSVSEYKLRWASTAWQVYMREDLQRLSDDDILALKHAMNFTSIADSIPLTTLPDTIDATTDTGL